MSKVFEKLVARRLSGYLESNNILPPQQFAYRKGLGTCDALLSITDKLQRALDIGGEARVVQIDFSAAFDRVNHAGLLYKLRSVGVGGPVLSIIEEFLTDRTQRVCVDGCFSRSADVVSGVPQGSVLGPLLFILYIGGLFDLVEIDLFSYADDATLVVVVPCPADILVVAESLNRDVSD